MEKEATYGSITVTNLSESTTVDYTLRAFNVKKKGCSEERKIYHYHFRVSIAIRLSRGQINAPSCHVSVTICVPFYLEIS